MIDIKQLIITKEGSWALQIRYSCLYYGWIIIIYTQRQYITFKKNTSELLEVYMNMFLNKKIK